MPVRRGHVAPQNTFLDTIIRKFEGQNRKFIIANARVENCAIIFCNDGFCVMCGYTRAEVMQKPCTCSFLYGPHTGRASVAQMTKALLGSEERKVEISLYRKDGVCLPCIVDVVPVKNEDGLVIMFILNFELADQLDRSVQDSSPNTDMNYKHTIPWLSKARRRRFRFSLPLLRSLSKQSLQEDTERGYIQQMPHMGHESVALDKLLSLPERSALGGSQLLLWEDKAQTEADGEPRPVSPPLPQGFSQSSPRLHNLTSEASPSSCSMAHSRSCESLFGMRPTPSTSDFNWDRKMPVRPNSTGAMHLKASLQNATSDSDLNRLRNSVRAAQLAHNNLIDIKQDHLIAVPSSEIDIIAPCKLIDRTHNVTDKVTQEAGERGGSVTSPRTVQTEEIKHAHLSVGIYQRTRGYPSSPTAGLLRVRRWFSQPAVITSLPVWDFQREEREQIQTVFLKAGEGGCDGEGVHRQFTLSKRQSVEKVDQMPRQIDDGSMLLMFILNSINRKAA
ncbi:Potassium voltage-gated channel subfamily H member 2 [Triplophysa tibetana]|uniref:Potassium voltage-gated channel subfamily H member 2 n=1 Tax=Triplophysa tibetana TaxID=1572043 RepID=A0A5A9PBL6_9TELE|nr:Potassium voltage-gated channel subfamily H member 2 [Triplophysa tibetana]